MLLDHQFTLLTIEDHRQFVAFEWITALLSKVKVESMLEHGFLLLLLICHHVIVLFHVAVFVCASILFTP